MPRPPLGERAMTDAERQRNHRERLRRERPPPPDPARLLREAQQEIDRLRQRVHALERHVAKPQPAKPARAQPAKPVDPDSEVARLKTTIRNLRIKVANMHEFSERERDRKGIMPFASYGTITRCLHPDQPSPTQEQRREAFVLFSQWWQAAKKQK